MLGISAKNIAKKNKRFKKEKNQQEQEQKNQRSDVTIKPDDTKKENLKTVSLLEGLVLDTSQVQTDDYVVWLTKNAKKTSSLPIVSSISGSDFIEDAIKKAVTRYNSGDFVKNQKEEVSMDQLVPHKLEVNIF
ncbi:hypothetical protein D7Y41_02655 [Anaerotruncus sp. 1XD22-93]|nr:hypothetical protein [Lachnospiraceae bacterium]NBI74237.1 hypothetical protein [Lachnospiraceae bacterium]RKK00374.1 hypothetical protein D7Y41_02655 [Anaerotruncus sp. 1XD22-93]